VPVPDLLQPFVGPLELLGMPYCITGSVAASVYGEPRLTADIDVVLLLSAQDITRLRMAFPEDQYYVPPEETMREQARRPSRGMFNLIHHASQFKADIYLAGDDPLHSWALTHRRRVDLDGEGVWVAPPEYVIVRKLEYYREGRSDKHLRDIRFILAATAVDCAMIDLEVAERGLSIEWHAIAG
jgi:hypothetical protein